MAKAPKTAKPAGEKKARKAQVRVVPKKVEYIPQDGATYIVGLGTPEEDIGSLVVAEEGDNKGKFNAVPEDFDPKIHKPLKRNQFVNEVLWFNLTADLLEAKAKRLRARGVELKKFGGSGMAKAKKLITAQKRFLELKAALAASGLNVDEILAGMASAEADVAVEQVAAE
jgi:hypothetical protein